MAGEIQWGVMDPTMPAKIAGSFDEGRQQAAQNALAAQQLQHAQAANELVKYQLSQAKRGDEAQNALAAAYQSAYNPQTGRLDENALMQSLAAGNVGYKIPEIQKQLTEQRAAQIKQAADSVNLMKSLATNVVANPTLQNATAALQHFSSVTGTDQSAEIARLQAIGENPQAIKQWAAGHAYTADQLMPKIQTLNLGGTERMIRIDPITGLPISQQDFQKTMTPGEAAANRIAAGNLAVNQKRLGLEAYKATPEYLAAETGAKETAKGQVSAKQALPQLESNVQEAVNNIDALIGKRNAQGQLLKGEQPHPGFGQSVGGGIPGLKYIPGTSEADFNARLEQLQGGAFLQAYNTLRGGGQITEVEGKKATAAISRMSTAQSEKEFIRAAQDFKDVLNKGLENARKAAGVKTSTIPGGWSVEEH